ncbi:hypothetical protein B0T16DRAFT_391830 [Cercophora newfieldiana]|uniref:Uncharacterized protein n=1 Tax=Cercophora newfieldiana TaxID=92897 RepID=A0AA40CLV5_9PEZI|nr:hypothetical protein B0T16DRAFT_391830 [Cercophora newfieldiana]
MHLFHSLAVWLVFVSQLAAGIPADTATEEVEISDGRRLSVVDTLMWMGPVFADGPNITLSGTPESVYKQLLKINPKYNAWDMPGYAEQATKLGLSRNGMVNAARGLESRQWGEVVCGHSDGNTIWDVDGCNLNWSYLVDLGGGCYAVPSSCTRVAPCRTCRFYFCDKTGNGIWGACVNIAFDMSHIYDTWFVAAGDGSEAGYQWRWREMILKRGTQKTRVPVDVVNSAKFCVPSPMSISRTHSP